MASSWRNIQDEDDDEAFDAYHEKRESILETPEISCSRSLLRYCLRDTNTKFYDAQK